MPRMTRVLAVVGLALSAAGCVTVPGGPGAAPSPNRSPEPAPGPAHEPPRADKDRPPRLVQGPVKEALSQLPDTGGDMTGSAPTAPHTTPPGARNGPETAGAHAQGAHEQQAHARRTARPRTAPEVRDRERELPNRAGLPTAGPSGAGICELGEVYGRWDPQSTQARACRAAYGD
ncbi:hypothetical protein [Streptomyces iconiensis]|uniref:Lipoprotein n=1 Tax=Streptomyces iconiensis TaxID=1384038 RepID=A0ABT7A2R4_9ACTN|nr:hypothetical protein [Streptomyces iconiensis]MDJ1135633.1 hypothetical protein [Streptomyces iconiensis]